MDRYKLSTYSILFPMEDEGHHWILRNGLYGAVDIVTEEEASLIRDGLTDRIGPETAARLRSRGHLVREEEDETENAAIISRVHWLIPYTKFVDIVVLPTYNCNFRCSYCFERCRLEKGQEWLSHKMTDATADAIIGQLEAMRKRRISIRSLILFGGEPLLPSNEDNVRKWIDYSVRIGAPYSVVSNGYELDHFLGLFREHPPKHIQITVDGPAEIHDSRRFLAGGKGSFDRIMENIGKAVAQGITINVRTNVNRSNLQSAMTLPGEYERLGLTADPRFSWYFKATTGCYEEDPSNAITEEELFNAMMRSGLTRDETVAHCRYYSAAASQLTQTLRGQSYPPLRPAFCGACSDMITVDPDGILYTCWDTVSLEEYSVGFLDTNRNKFIYNFDFPKWRNRTADKIEKCRSCPYIMLCGGGCAMEAIQLNGSLLSENCGDTPAIQQEVVPAICRESFLKNGELSPGFSWYDLFVNLTAEDRETLMTCTDSGKVWSLVRKQMPESDKIFS